MLLSTPDYWVHTLGHKDTLCPHATYPARAQQQERAFDKVKITRSWAMGHKAGQGGNVFTLEREIN